MVGARVRAEQQTGGGEVIGSIDSGCPQSTQTRARVKSKDFRTLLFLCKWLEDEG